MTSRDGKGSRIAGYAFGFGSAALGAAYFCIGTYLVKPLAGVSVREFTSTVYEWATLFGFLAVLPTRDRPQLRLQAAHVPALVLLGLLFGASVVLAFDAVRWMDPASAATLFRTSVFFALAFGFLILKERLTLREGAGALLVTAGVAGVLGTGGELLARGPLEALACAACTALYQVVAKRTVASVPPQVVNAYRNLFTLLLFLAAGRAMGWEPARAAGQTYGLIVLAALVGPVVHSRLNLESLARLPLLHAVLVAQTQPVFVLAMAAPWSPLPGVREILADAAILAGVILLAVASAARRAGASDRQDAVREAPR
jgi:drug/metabolite transporter (DMT)-like permease